MAVAETAVIVAGCRTPIGKFQGALSSLKATELASQVPSPHSRLKLCP